MIEDWAGIKIPLVMDGPMPPIVTVVEMNQELYWIGELAKEEET